MPQGGQPPQGHPEQPPHEKGGQPPHDGGHMEQLPHEGGEHHEGDHFVPYYGYYYRYPSYSYLYYTQPYYTQPYYTQPYYTQPAYWQSCSVSTDRQSYRLGETVIFYYSAPIGTTAWLTTYLPDGSVAWRSDPTLMNTGTSSSMTQIWYPTGQRSVVLQTSNGCSSTAYFDVY